MSAGSNFDQHAAYVVAAFVAGGWRFTLLKRLIGARSKKSGAAIPLLRHGDAVSGSCGPNGDAAVAVGWGSVR